MNQMAISFVETRARRSDPQTSRDAAKHAASGKAEAERIAIRQSLDRVKPYGHDGARDRGRYRHRLHHRPKANFRVGRIAHDRAPRWLRYLDVNLICANVPETNSPIFDYPSPVVGQREYAPQHEVSVVPQDASAFAKGSVHDRSA